MSDYFSYELPLQFIAQRPVEPRHSARLLVAEVSRQCIEDATFIDLPKWLKAGDLLVLNNTKVIPARLIGKIASNGQECELLLLRKISGASWACMGQPLKKMVSQGSLEFGAGLRARVLRRLEDYQVEVEFCDSHQNPALEAQLEAQGLMPIPPYIRAGRADRQDQIDYQNIFAVSKGSIAAPTAGLHFSTELLNSLQAQGVLIAYVTLHVGPASFLALQSQDSSGALRSPGKETYLFDPELKDLLQHTRQAGAKIIAVGTTTVRALESMFRLERAAKELLETDLFIRPGFDFKAIDRIITNFHQPHTTHLLLLEAFMGRQLLERSYRHAREQHYRFLSYGDGMLIY